MDNKKEIEILANKKSTYGIFVLIIAVILICLCILIAVKYGHKPIMALGLLVIPLTLFIIVLKIVIWNFFGKEKILIQKNNLEVRYNYGFIYGETSKRLSFKKLKPSLLTNVSSDEISFDDVNLQLYNKAQFKLKFLLDGDEIFTSSLPISKPKILEIIALIRS